VTSAVRRAVAGERGRRRLVFGVDRLGVGPACRQQVLLRAAAGWILAAGRFPIGRYVLLAGGGLVLVRGVDGSSSWLSRKLVKPLAARTSTVTTMAMIGPVLCWRTDFPGLCGENAEMPLLIMFQGKLPRA